MVKIKTSPSQAMKAHEGYGCKSPHTGLHSHSRLTLGKSHRYSLYRRPSGPQDRSVQEGVKKNLHPSLGGLPSDVSEEPVTYEKRKKGWRMSCDVGKATEGLENELCRR